MRCSTSFYTFTVIYVNHQTWQSEQSNYFCLVQEKKSLLGLGLSPETKLWREAFEEKEKQQESKFFVLSPIAMPTCSLMVTHQQLQPLTHFPSTNTSEV